MKNCYYDGDIEKDIKKINKKHKFNWGSFLFMSGISAICAVIGCGIVALFMRKITSATIGSFIGIMIVNTYKNIKESKEDIAYEEDKLIDLYKEINDEYSKPVSDALAKSKIKDCIIQTEKINDVKRDSNNKVVSKTEKIIKYFYLLDPNDRIQILKQINEVIKKNGEKEQNIDLYLLEDEEIKEEIIEMPVEKTLKLKDNKRG